MIQMMKTYFNLRVPLNRLQYLKLIKSTLEEFMLREIVARFQGFDSRRLRKEIVDEDLLGIKSGIQNLHILKTRSNNPVE